MRATAAMYSDCGLRLHEYAPSPPCVFNRRRRQASPAAIAALCRAVESAVSDNARITTPTVDVFVRENLFPDAISSSQERLAAAADEEGLVAWGNTNTQVRRPSGQAPEFVVGGGALDAASCTQFVCLVCS